MTRNAMARAALVVALAALASAGDCNPFVERVFYRCSVEWDCDGQVVADDQFEACVDREDDITQNATKADAEDACGVIINCIGGTQATCTPTCAITEEVCVVDAGTT